MKISTLLPYGLPTILTLQREHTGALKMPHFQDALLPSYSDADLTELILKAPRLPGSGSICLLSDNHLVKFCHTYRIEDTMQAVRVARQLGIRAPSVKRVIEVDNHMYYIMERIKGATLEEVWPKLNWLMMACLAVPYSFISQFADFA